MSNRLRRKPRAFFHRRIPSLGLVFALAGSLLLARPAQAQPLNNGEYLLHEDGGIIYNPLSREAKRKGQLDKFNSAPKKIGTLELGGVRVRYEVPQQAVAYEVVPIKYTLENAKADGKRPIAVECTAFEDKARKKGRALYDMSLPGDLSVNMEYVGCVSATAASPRPLLDPRNPNPEIKDYPAWQSGPLVRSGVLRKADHNWFTFKYTVTGDTIFDPEGFNGIQSELNLLKKKPDGKYDQFSTGINHWERNVNYQYPGESCEQTVMFRCAGGSLPVGEYKLRYTLWQKGYSKWTQWGNYSKGEAFAYLDVYLTVVDTNPEPVEPKVEQVLLAPAKRASGNFPEFIHSFEEFMTGFEWYRTPVQKVESVIYVQVAPWTEQLDLKLIMGSPMELKAVSIPVTVSTENLALKYNPDNPFVLVRNGKEEPVIVGQLMPSMRHSVHFGHRPDLIMQDLVKDAQDSGVNVYASESGGYALGDFFRKKHEAISEATKYFNVNLKNFGMPMLGFGIYNVQESYKIGNKLLDPPINVPTSKEFDSSHHSSPEWAQTWAAVVLYNHKLWGDNWYKTKDGRTIIDIEDSVGWMREGINIRYSLGEKAIREFQQWCRNKYGTLEKLNHAWSSNFKDFAQINPEENQSAEARNGYKWEYYQKTNPVFYDWSPAVEDLDIFRSELRCAGYQQVMDIVRKTIPGATFDLRTEGGNFIIPDSSKLGDTPHELHVKYSARRNAEIGEVLSKHGDLIGFYSDYTPVAYTPDEWRKFTRLSVEKGIRPMPLPHVARARDMAIQQKYGGDYTAHYNLKYPAKAAMVFGLQALFPVMQAVYEEGGCPGVIWADYTCDVFVTETQKRELKILRSAMNKIAKPAPAGK